MGVPALFRWLSQKYPKIISSVIEDKPVEMPDGSKIPIDATKPNPNNEEFDNLYLDMNGIVHPCSHPEDRPPPANEEEMMLEVFKYTERVVNMVRPRKLLMIAVDGVAPRAKMNQQRSRRFRSAQEAKEKDEDKAEFMKMLKSKNEAGLDSEVQAALVKKTWDSNSITPGTPFMDILAASLRYWIAYKLNTDPAWEKLKIIISDATVPGEGEHKIMEFIRSQRRSPHHDPNTRHVIYGLDADLIMLGLATHEPHFRVLREDVFFQEAKQRTCRRCGQTGHYTDQCKGEAKKKEDELDIKQNVVTEKPFIWLHVSILREYLEAELYVPNQPFAFDLERALDDWVFMCFFVGNDFLPHLPSLDIREQGIDTLIAIWRDNIPAMGGYVTKDGHVDLERAQLILSGLAKQEDSIFKRRRQTEERKEAAAKRRKLQQEGGGRRGGRYSTEGVGGGEVRGRRPKETAENFANMPLFSPGDLQSKEARSMTHENFVNRKAIFQANQANKSAAAVLKEGLLGKKPSSEVTATMDTDGDADESSVPDTSAPDTPGDDVATSPSTLGKRKADLIEDDNSTPGRNTPDLASKPKPADDEAPPDTVRLWEEGYADRYYEQKFHVDPKDIEFRRKVGRDYVEGLAWVLLYYFQGCPSWTWYYPHHYAPFAADFVDIGKMKINFEKGKPFRPYEQLMGVMPAASNHTIPEVFRPLMTDEDSDIVDFYPTEFPIDLNGKKFAWQGVALLPFIDEKRLLKAMATKYPLLTPEEHARNEFGKEVLLFSTRHPLYEEIVTNFYSKKQGAPKYKLDPKVSEGLSGKVEKNEDYLPQSALAFPLPSGGMPDLEEDQSISVHFEMPTSSHIHKSMLLRGVKFPQKALDRSEFEATRSRAGRSGRSFGGVPFREDNRGYSSHNQNRWNNGPGPVRPPQNGGNAQINPDNPIAQYLNPNFDPNVFGRAPPPPQLAAMNGWTPPPPPQFTGNGGYGGGHGGGYGGQQSGRGGHGGPPPPGQYNGYNGGRRQDDQYRPRQDDSYRPGGDGGYRGRERGGGHRGGRGGGTRGGYGGGRNYDRY